MLAVDMIHANLNHICHKAESTQDGRFFRTSGKHDHLLSPLHQILTKEINGNMLNVKKNENKKHIHKDMCKCPQRRKKLVDRREQAKLQWLQDPSNADDDNLSDVRWEASRHFRNKKREYLKDNINKLESDSKNKNIRDL
jgi:hypothetical protein